MALNILPCIAGEPAAGEELETFGEKMLYRLQLTYFF